MKVERKLFDYARFYHVWYGWIDMTRPTAEQFQQHFSEGIPAYKVQLNVEHDHHLGKFGNVVGLNVKDDGLYAEFDLTDEGTELFDKERFEYTSIEYSDWYTDPRNASEVKNVLLGVALTNNPANPFAGKLFSDKSDGRKSKILNFSEGQCIEKGDGTKMEYKELYENMKKELSDAKKELGETKTKLAETQKELNETKAAKETTETELTETKTKLSESEKIVKKLSNDVETQNIQVWETAQINAGILPTTVKKFSEKMRTEGFEKTKAFAEGVLQTVGKVDLSQQTGGEDGQENPNNGVQLSDIAKKAQADAARFNGGE